MAKKNKFELTPLSVILMFVIGVLVIMLTVVVSSSQQNLQSDAAGNGGGPTYEGGSISLNEDPSTLTLGSSVTFTTTVPKLKGSEYPLIAIECFQDGTPVYVGLDFPDSAFVLGGASSLWVITGGPATCQAKLYAYGVKYKGYTIEKLLAKTPMFDVQGQ